MKRLQSLSYKTLFAILFFALAGIVFFLKIGGKTSKVSAAWWDDAWHYRKAISITNSSGSNLTDFQVSVSIGTSQLIADGKMQTDCDDIRITDINGNLLPYWIETGTCNTDITNIISKIDSLPVAGSTIYIYYGNPSAQTATKASAVPRTCSNVNAFFGTGLYYVNPTGTDASTPVKAYCDMTTDGGGWTLVGSWNTAQEWTKAANSSSVVFDTTAKDTVSSNFGNAPINDFRVLASDLVTSVGTSAYADWYYHYNSATSWKEVWAPTSNNGGNSSAGYISTSPRQALKPFNYSYNLKFSYQVTQTWNNLSDWGINVTSYYNLPNYWAALTSPGNKFGIYNAVTGGGSNDGSFGICPSGSSNCITGQDMSTNQSKVGYDDGIPSASFGATATSNVGANPPVDVTTKLWWFIRNGTPTSNNYSVTSSGSEESGGGPIAYWKFDEGVGSTAYDSSSNQNNGTISGATWQTEDQCISGKCLKFDGVSDYINIGTSNIISGTTYTVEAWFKTQDVSKNQDIFAQRNSSNSNSIMGQLYINSGKITFITRNDSGGNSALAQGSTTLINNTWYHAVGVRSGSNVYIYLNGKLEGSDNDAGGTITSNTNDIGRANYGGTYVDYLNSYIDDLKIYPYARTAAQIKLDYNSRGSSKGTSVNMGSSDGGINLSNGLVSYWKMDEGVGTSITDSSGLGHTGTFSGSTLPTWSNGKYGIGISFNGSSSYINFDNPGLSSLSNATISFWRKAVNSSAWLLFKGQTTSHYIMATSGTGAFYHANIGSVTKIYVDGNLATTPLTDNNWHHYVITGVNLSGWTNLNLSNYPNFHYNGQIDEIRLYNRSLSPAEVSSLYNYAPGPVGYWDFNDGSGTSVVDKSGNNNTGTWSGTGSHWTQGKIGGAGNFNGTSDRTGILYSPLLAPSGSITFSAWAYKNNWTSAEASRIISKTETGGYALFFSSSTIYTYIYRNGAYANPSVSTTGLSPGWHYFTGSYDGRYTKIYIDGILKNTNDAGANYPISYSVNNTLFIGAEADGNNDQTPESVFFTGKIDDVKIYNYARTQKQIIEDMNSGAPATSSKSMIAHYKFDEGSGTTVYNSGNAGSALNGISSNSPIWTNSGKFNKALSFDGTNDYIRIPQSSAINSLNEFSIGFWINHDGTNSDRYIFYKGANSPSYAINISGNTIGLDYWTSSGVRTDVGSISVSPNQWHQVVFSFKENNLAKFYLDGKLSTTTSVSSTIRTNSEDLYFNTYGGTTGSYNVKGLFDEVKIYNYALTADEVKQDYNQGSAISFGSTSQTIGATTTSLDYCIPGDTSYCAAPIAEWKMDEGVGTSIVDTSGNGYNGTFNNSPSWVQGKIGKAVSVNPTNNSSVTTTFNSQLTSYTAEAWVKPSSFTSSNGEINGYGFTVMAASANYPVWITVKNTGEVRAYAFTSSTSTFGETSGANIEINKWSHIAVSATQNGTVTIYVNGISLTSFTADNVSWPSNSVITIGDLRANRNINFDGAIDQVKIYNYIRTPAQIAYDYNKGGPVGWWKFDECQGNIAYDWSGIGNTGVISIGSGGSQNSLGTCAVGTSAAWTNGATGKINSSLNFDGTDDYVWLGTPTMLSPKNISVSSWFKISSDSTSGVIIRNRTYGYALRILSGTINANLYESSSGFLSISTSTKYGDSQWHNAISTYDGNTIKLYVDGSLITSQAGTNTGIIYYAGNAIAIGRDADNSNSYFTGQIDDVRIYNYALTSEQVKQVYNDGAVNFQ